MIHRDYLQLGAEVHIDMYDDRIEITNPGGMLEGKPIQDRNPRRVPSKTRNPIIADVFDRMKYMERRGSGFKKILDDYEAQDKYEEKFKPEFYSDTGDFRLTLWNLNYNTVPSKMPKRQNDVLGDVLDDVLADIILSELHENPELTQKELSQKCNVPYRSLQRKMDKLKESGVVTRVGGKRYGHWEIKR